MSDETPPKPSFGARLTERAVELRDRLRKLPRWTPLLVGILLGAACGGGYGLLATPQYSATSYVVAAPTERADPAAALGFAQAYGRVATSPSVLRDAQSAAGVPAAELREHVQSATSPDAPMIEITGTGARPQRAAATANAVAAALTESSRDAAKSTGVQLSVLAPAHAPSAPSSPSTLLATAVGLCAGGLVGGLLLLVRPTRRDEQPAVPAPASPEPAAVTPAREEEPREPPATARAGGKAARGKVKEGAR